MRSIVPIVIAVVALLWGASGFIYNASADMPRRVSRPLSVLLKTTAYGTATGAVFGVGIAALSGGGPKTFGKITSLGMYTGILVGMYILLAPPEMIFNSPDQKKGDDEDSNPQRWPNESEQEEQSQAVPGPRANPALWLPVVTSHF